MANEIRRFTKEDWYGWAGAERFSNNSEPFIYESTLNEGSVELTIIADINGVGIYMYCSETEDYLGWMKSKRLASPIRAEGELRALVREIEKYSYAPDLSYVIDNPSSNPVFEGFEDVM